MAPREAIDRLRRADPVLLWGFAVVAAVFVYTLANLATRSLWWDELFTFSLATPDAPDADAIAQIRGDVHPPLYFYGARVWLQIWQTSSDFALRAFNLLPFGFALWMGFSALRRPSTQPMALWLVLFFTAFGVYWYLQEARMYAMMIAQALCGSLVVLDFERRRLEPLTAGYVAILAVTFVILPLGHWFSLGFAGLLLVALLGWSLLERRMGFAALFFALGLILGASGLAWIVLNAKATLGAVDGYGSWVYGGTLSFYGLRITAIGLMLFTFTLNPILILAAGLGVWRAVRAPRQNIGPLILLAVSAVLAAAILAVSLIAAMYQTRNFVWAIAPLTLFAAMGLQFAFDRLKLSRARQTVAMLAVLAISLAIAPFANRLSQLETDAWKAAGHYVSTTPGCETGEILAAAMWLGPTPVGSDFRSSQRMYGHYAGGPERMKLVLRGQTAALNEASACPIALWVANANEASARPIARDILGASAEALDIQTFEGHVIFVRPKVEQAATQ